MNWRAPVKGVLALFLAVLLVAVAGAAALNAQDAGPATPAEPGACTGSVCTPQPTR